MSLLYTVAYPEISPADSSFIQKFRQQNDLPYRDVIKTHFTLVFGCQAIKESDYRAHIQDIASACAPIHFCCRYAMLGADDQDDTAYVFLVPDEGYSHLSLLHDRLYTGILESHLRLQIHFIPHITIGTLKDWKLAKSLCDGLNQRGLEMKGVVTTLTVGKLENGTFKNLSVQTLGTPAHAP